MRKRQLEVAAYHEAGHFVAAIEYGLNVLTVSVSANGGGHVVHGSAFRRRIPDTMKFNQPGEFKERIERLVIIFLAGREAQRRFAPRSVRHYHSQSDMQNAVDMFTHICDPSSEEWPVYFKLQHVRTRSLLTRRWPGVVAVAEALVQRAKVFAPERFGWTITGEEARKIYLAGLDHGILR